MEVVIRENPAEVCRYAARLVSRVIRGKPDCVLGLAAGSSQLGFFRELIREHQEEGLDFSQVTAFLVDEYVGLPPTHECSYHSLMQKNFFSHLNIAPEKIFIPDGMSSDIRAECADYENKIVEAGGLDVQMLGLSAEGHIGFNEPTSSLGSRTRLKMLTEKTRYNNSRFFSSYDEVPRHVITMGVGSIMDARTIVLLAFGRAKAGVISRVIEGSVTAMVPASVLQFHPHVKVIIDEDAAGQLRMKDYYKWAFEQKPEWQRV